MDRTEREEFWIGYERGRASLSPERIAQAERLLWLALGTKGEIRTAIEFGAGNGPFQKALAALYPDARRAATEISPEASRALEELCDDVYEVSVLESFPLGQYDLVLAMGLLACVGPEDTPRAYDGLYAACGRYLLVRDYFTEGEPRKRPYGEASIQQRDYAREIQERFPDLRLVASSSDSVPEGSMMDLGWFLFEKER